PETLEVPPNFVDLPGMRQALATYYAMVENLDWNIGRLLEAIESDPRFRDNTLIVYLSDHGDHIGCRGLINEKSHSHEASTRIPPIFRWPGRIPAQGLGREELISLVDLLPTTLGLAGAPIPPHLQGIDFSPTLRGEPFEGPDAVLLAMCGTPRW